MKNPIVQTVYVLVNDDGLFWMDSTEHHNEYATHFYDAYIFINHELAKRFKKDKALNQVEIYKVKLEPIMVNSTT